MSNNASLRLRSVQNLDVNEFRRRAADQIFGKDRDQLPATRTGEPAPKGEPRKPATKSTEPETKPTRDPTVHQIDVNEEMRRARDLLFG